MKRLATKQFRFSTRLCPSLQLATSSKLEGMSYYCQERNKTGINRQQTRYQFHSNPTPHLKHVICLQVGSAQSLEATLGSDFNPELCNSKIYTYIGHVRTPARTYIGNVYTMLLYPHIFSLSWSYFDLERNKVSDKTIQTN